MNSNSKCIIENLNQIRKNIFERYNEWTKVSTIHLLNPIKFFELNDKFKVLKDVLYI